MGSMLGVRKVAAARIGMALDEYDRRVSSGEKFCWRCSAWHARGEFAHDKTRTDGLSSSCAYSRNRAARTQRAPRTRTSRKGTFLAKTRSGDKRQARHRVNHHVHLGLIPRPNDLPCVDCGHRWAPGERRHEYDHHLGYSSDFQLEVQAVCTSCHYERERTRTNGDMP